MSSVAQEDRHTRAGYDKSIVSQGKRTDKELSFFRLEVFFGSDLVDRIQDAEDQGESCPSRHTLHSVDRTELQHRQTAQSMENLDQTGNSQKLV